MKINSTTLNIGYPRGRGMEHSKSCVPMSEYKRHKSAYECDNFNKQNNNDKINTTITSNSDGRVSFRGGVPLVHFAANFTSENPLVAEAMFAILITCGLRPLTIMATAKTEEDKGKCSYQAAKSISSGLVGLATTALIGTPIAEAAKKAKERGAFNMPTEMKEQAVNTVNKGVEALTGFADELRSQGGDKVLEEQISKLTEGNKLNLSVLKKAGKGAEKSFTDKIAEKAPNILNDVENALKEQQILNNYARTGKNVIDKFFQPVFMPLRATITIALVPIILNAFGQHKPASKAKEEPACPFEYMNNNVFHNNNEKELFQSFTGVTSHANK